MDYLISIFRLMACGEFLPGPVPVTQDGVSKQCSMLVLKYYYQAYVDPADNPLYYTSAYPMPFHPPVSNEGRSAKVLFSNDASNPAQTNKEYGSAFGNKRALFQYELVANQKFTAPPSGEDCTQVHADYEKQSS
jgi:hypothetical protein